MKFDRPVNVEDMGELLQLMCRQRPDDRAWHEEIASRAWQTPLEALDPRVFAQDEPGGHRYFDVGWPNQDQFAGVRFQDTADMLIHEAACHRFISPLGPAIYILTPGDAVAMETYGRLWPEGSRLDAPATDIAHYTNPEGVQLATGAPPHEILPQRSRVSLSFVLKTAVGVAEPKVMTVRPNVPGLVPDLTFNVFGSSLRTEKERRFVREALAMCLPRHLQPRLVIFDVNKFPDDRWEPLLPPANEAFQVGDIIFQERPVAGLPYPTGYWVLCDLEEARAWVALFGDGAGIANWYEISVEDLGAFKATGERAEIRGGRYE